VTRNFHSDGSLISTFVDARPRVLKCRFKARGTSQAPNKTHRLFTYCYISLY
jgi:hypothetical protein